jgi:transposase-like protein
VVSVPVLGVIGVFPDGHKHLLAPRPVRRRLVRGVERLPRVARGLRAPVLTIIDGNAGLRRPVGLAWPRAVVQCCCVHKLRNLARKAPKHALAEIRDNFHRIVYAANADTARTAYAAVERTWSKRCPGVVTSLRQQPPNTARRPRSE